MGKRLVNYVMASLFLIIIGCVLIYLGYLIWNYWGDETSFQAAPVCAIVGVLLIPIGIVTFFNHAMLNDVLQSLALFLHHLAQQYQNS
jgi:uncharacterized membrane protein